MGFIPTTVVYFVLISSTSFTQIEPADYCKRFADAKPEAVFRIESTPGHDHTGIAVYCPGGCNFEPHGPTLSIKKLDRPPTCTKIPGKKTERVVIDEVPERWELREERP